MSARAGENVNNISQEVAGGRRRKEPHARVRRKEQDRATRRITRAKQEVENGAVGSRGGQNVMFSTF